MIIQITGKSVLSFKLDTESTDTNVEHVQYAIKNSNLL